MADESTYGKLYNLLSEQEKKDYNKWIKSDLGKQSRSLIGSDYSVQRWKTFVSESARFGPPAEVIRPVTTGQFPGTRATRMAAALAWKPPSTAPIAPTKTAIPSPPEVVFSGGFKWRWIVDPTAPEGGFWTNLGAVDTLEREKFEWTKAQTPLPTPEHGGGTIAEVVSEGGYDFQIYRRPDGSASDKVLIGRTATPEGRDWQEGAEAARVAESRRRWDIEQAEKAEDPELQRATNELRWERDRIQLLSGLPSDDWISRYTLQNQPNPYVKRAVSPYETLESNLDTQTVKIQNWQNELVNVLNAESAGEPPVPNRPNSAEIRVILDEATRERDKLYGAWKAMGTEAKDWTPQPYPNAPSWLPQYAPLQREGKMITPQNVPTPSGQQLTQMSPSRAGELGYFADWTKKMGGGRNWKDILGEAELMQPFTPRGAGGFRTSPARQWV